MNVPSKIEWNGNERKKKKREWKEMEKLKTRIRWKSKWNGSNPYARKLWTNWNWEMVSNCSRARIHTRHHRVKQQQQKRNLFRLKKIARARHSRVHQDIETRHFFGCRHHRRMEYVTSGTICVRRQKTNDEKKRKWIETYRYSVFKYVFGNGIETNGNDLLVQFLKIQ